MGQDKRKNNTTGGQVMNKDKIKTNKLDLYKAMELRNNLGSQWTQQCQLVEKMEKETRELLDLTCYVDGETGSIIIVVPLELLHDLGISETIPMMYEIDHKTNDRLLHICARPKL